MSSARLIYVSRAIPWSTPSTSSMWHHNETTQMGWTQTDCHSSQEKKISLFCQFCKYLQMTERSEKRDLPDLPSQAAIHDSPAPNSEELVPIRVTACQAAGSQIVHVFSKHSSSRPRIFAFLCMTASPRQTLTTRSSFRQSSVCCFLFVFLCQGK